MKSDKLMGVALMATWVAMFVSHRRTMALIEALVVDSSATKSHLHEISDGLNHLGQDVEPRKRHLTVVK